MARTFTPKHHGLLQVADLLSRPALTPPRRQSWIFGLPKSGTTLFAKAISVQADESVLLDTPLLWGTANQPLTEPELASIRQKHPVTFSARIVKEPNATLYPEAVHAALPEARHILLVRNPLDNIRSHLDRVQIPGNATSVSDLDIPPSYKRFFERYADLPPALALAHRWNRVHKKPIWKCDSIAVFFYEDLMEQPQTVTEKAVRHIGLTPQQTVEDVFATQYQSKGKNRGALAQDFFGSDFARKIQDLTATTHAEIKSLKHAG